MTTLAYICIGVVAFLSIIDWAVSASGPAGGKNPDGTLPKESAQAKASTGWGFGSVAFMIVILLVLVIGGIQIARAYDDHSDPKSGEPAAFLEPEEQNTYLRAVKPDVIVFDTVWYSANPVTPIELDAYRGNQIPSEARLFEIRQSFINSDGELVLEPIGAHDYWVASAHSMREDRGKVVHVKCLTWSHNEERYVPMKGGDFEWTLGPGTFPRARFLAGTRAFLVYADEPVKLGFVFRKP